MTSAKCSIMLADTTYVSSASDIRRAQVESIGDNPAELEEVKIISDAINETWNDRNTKVTVKFEAEPVVVMFFSKECGYSVFVGYGHTVISWGQ